jgi:hypothetical protein
MRMYGKRTGSKIRERLRIVQAETRDAVLWDIQEDQRICRVKIQNSNEFVYAHYPRNWSKTPVWLKIGNAVSIRYRAGIRGWVEVIGHGRALPTAIAGGTAQPPVPASGDGILSGLLVEPASPPGMQINITAGFYRLNDTVYSLGGFDISGFVMNDPAPMTMDVGGYVTMGEVVGYVDVDAADPTLFRYDLIVVGEDQVIDYIVGTPAATNPAMPETPDDHVVLNWILILPGMTEITTKWIGYTWTTPFYNYMVITYTAAKQVEWPIGTRYIGQYSAPTATVTATTYDQYDLVFRHAGLQIWNLQKLGGDGDFCGTPDGNDICAQSRYNAYDASWTWSWPTIERFDDEEPYPSLGWEQYASLPPAFKIWITGTDIEMPGNLVLVDYTGNLVGYT